MNNASKPHRGPWINLGLGLALGLALLAALLAEPIQIMLTVRAFDRGETDSTAIQAKLEAYGEKAIPGLIERCLSARCHSRERLAKYLAQEAPEQALQALTKAAKEPPGDRVVYALEALGYFDHEEARRVLERYSQSDEEALRQTAIRSLAILHRPKTIDEAS
jgi:HEAT repeat protein